MTQALSDVLQAIPLPTLAIDKTERISAANAEALVLLGQGIVGRNYVTMLRQPALIETVEAALRDGTSGNARYLSSEGARDMMYDVTVRAMGSDGAVLLSFMDVTQVEQAERMRRDFVANVSHELRTPLTALMGFIETLRGPARDDTEARDRFLDIMEGEAGRMNRLVGDLLSLSRVEGDERVRPQDEVELYGVLASVLRTLTPLADEAGVVLEAPESAAPLRLAGDQDQLMQVFTNLVENAIKYGASGGRVKVLVETTPRNPALRAPGVSVKVIDDGPGISDKHLPRLTERFYRADSHRSRALGGTGLGLAIVKHIVNRHRGRLRIESEMGKGATFTVILPLQADRQARA